MTKMYDKDFDPLQSLADIQGQLLQCSKNITQIALAHNQARELQQQMITQLNEMTAAINAHDVSLYDLHDRVRLLEAARQYETTKNNHTTYDNTTQTDNQHLNVGQTNMPNDLQ